MSSPHIHVFSTVPQLVDDAAERIVKAFNAAVDESRLFSLFLSGGSTPKALFERLASDDYRKRIDWRSVQIFFGDERCVPPQSALSNYSMAKASLLDRVPIAAKNVFRMKGELDPEAAAKEYGQMLRDQFQDEGPDVLLLGMGDDGHTASLFPGTTALAETHHRCVANHVPHDYIPQGTNWRITLTYPFINRARQVLILVTGASKASRLKEVLEGERDLARLPIQGVEPVGELHWLLDSHAAGMDQE
jgi:6-phosphogluconolactonase